MICLPSFPPPKRGFALSFPAFVFLISFNRFMLPWHKLSFPEHWAPEHRTITQKPLPAESFWSQTNYFNKNSSLWMMGRIDCNWNVLAKILTRWFAQRISWASVSSCTQGGQVRSLRIALPSRLPWFMCILTHVWFFCYSNQTIFAEINVPK